MIVLPEARGTGIGSKLVEEVKKWAKLKKVKRLKVIASSNNSRAIEFYKKKGFQDYDTVLEQDI